MTTTTNTKIKIKCTRCNGFGFCSFKHIDGGRCFQCWGDGFVVVDAEEYAAERAAEEMAKKARIKAANEAQLRRPYTVWCDNVSECIGREFATWEEAKAWSVELSERNGYTYRVAKFDGECFRYRDGQQVKWAH